MEIYQITILEFGAAFGNISPAIIFEGPTMINLQFDHQPYIQEGVIDNFQVCPHLSPKYTLCNHLQQNRYGNLTVEPKQLHSHITYDFSIYKMELRVFYAYY